MADSVVIGNPSYDGGKKTFWCCYSRMIRASRKAGIDIQGRIPVRNCYIEHSRNIITDRFLHRSKADWILWLDDDQTFHEDLLIRMLAHQKRIVVGNYYRKSAPYLPIVSILEDDGRLSPAHIRPDAGKLRRVHCAATGCCLVHRSVMEKVPFPWFFNDYSPPMTADTDPDVLVNGMVLIGEDTRFFMLVNGLGFKVWCDFSLEIGHITIDGNGQEKVITYEDFENHYGRNKRDNQGESAPFRGHCH